MRADMSAKGLTDPTAHLLIEADAIFDDDHNSADTNDVVAADTVAAAAGATLSTVPVF